LPIFDCKEEKKNAGCRSFESSSGIQVSPLCVKICSRAEKVDSLSFVNARAQAPLKTPFSRCLHR
jgi:hypothetical protein